MISKRGGFQTEGDEQRAAGAELVGEAAQQRAPEALVTPTAT